MLVELFVKDFAIIDEVRLSFDQGLNVISGETGAGKSVLLRSLGLLMGAKSQSNDLRADSEQAVVEGLFDVSHRTDIQQRLQEKELNTELGELIVRRVMSRSGKSKVYINGSLSTLADLKDLVSPLITVTGRSAPLIEVTGQHDNKHLMSSGFHLQLLDHFCKTQKLVEQVKSTSLELQALEQKKEQLLQSLTARNQRIDFIKFQIEEIEKLEIDPEKDAHLSEDIQRLKSQGKLNEFFQNMQQELESDGGAAAQLGQLLHQARQFQQKSLEPVEQLLEEALTSLDEASFQGHQLLQEVDQELSLNELEERLASIRKLERKYGLGLETILKSYDEMKEELLQLEESDEYLAQIELTKKALLEELEPVLKELSKKRLSGAKKLSQQVNEQLKDLNMKSVLFSVSVEATKTLTQTGRDDVTFMIQQGKETEVRPLHKTASGGELSRILLSLKVCQGKGDLPRTYLFDEVDTGVSGPTAERVGHKLQSIAKDQQVICVTHLPQVASFGDHHYKISKEEKRGRVRMQAESLGKKQRIEELARLLSGKKITKASLQQAQNLLQQQ